MTVGETVLPLALARLGVIAGGLIGGRIADSRRRLSLLTFAASLGGLLAVLVFVGTCFSLANRGLRLWGLGVAEGIIFNYSNTVIEVG